MKPITIILNRRCGTAACLKQIGSSSGQPFRRFRHHQWLPQVNIMRRLNIFGERE